MKVYIRWINEFSNQELVEEKRVPNVWNYENYNRKENGMYYICHVSKANFEITLELIKIIKQRIL